MKIPQNYHIFALFAPPNMGNLMIPGLLNVFSWFWPEQSWYNKLSSLPSEVFNKRLLPLHHRIFQVLVKGGRDYVTP